jgi:hypothetical protein
MNQSLQTTPGFAGTGALAVDRNRVLRNTYWLLALSLIPTVLGAWVGVATGITAQMGMGVSLIVFLAGSFGLIYAIERNKESSAGVYLLLAFTFFMGLMLSRLIAQVLGFRNGTSLVMSRLHPEIDPLKPEWPEPIYLAGGALLLLVGWRLAGRFLSSAPPPLTAERSSP